jgi:serine/threonine protein kinase
VFTTQVALTECGCFGVYCRIVAFVLKPKLVFACFTTPMFSSRPAAQWSLKCLTVFAWVVSRKLMEYKTIKGEHWQIPPPCSRRFQTPVSFSGKYLVLEPRTSNGLAVAVRHNINDSRKRRSCQELYRSQDKVFIKQSDDPKLLGQEALNWSQLRSDIHSERYLASLVDQVQDARSAALVFEHCNIGSLDEFVQGLFERKLQLPAALVQAVAFQASLAIAAVHNAGWVHGDVALRNLLVDCDLKSQEVVVKLFDFGSCRRVKSIAPSASRPRSPSASSPKQATASADLSGDVFSFGLVLYQMLSFDFRPVDEAAASFVEQRRQGMANRLLAVDPDYSDLAKLTCDMLAADPARRPCIEVVSKQLAANLPPAGTPL